MESAGLRSRERLSSNGTSTVAEKEQAHSSYDKLRPPKYTIDLSLPPAKRYQHVAKDFTEEIESLPGLFDEIVGQLSPNISVSNVRRLARVLLRRVHNREQTEELRGLHQSTGVDMYLLVAFNVILDVLMGCTSGGVRVQDGQGKTKMLHFRTLDWGMDPLRKVVVEYDFVEKAGGGVVATTITYLGFVGFLTGVKKNLSVSLNFRPTHDSSNWLASVRFYSHHLLVLLGIRPAISSILRQVLIPTLKSPSNVRSIGGTLDSIERNLPSMKTTATYLIFSDGDRTVTMEKDNHTAVVRSSKEFIVTTNHDQSDESRPKSEIAAQDASGRTLQVTGMEGVVEDSILRKEVAVRRWEKHSEAAKSASRNGPDCQPVFLTTEKVVDWVESYPTANEETHFAVVMDPKEGKVIYARRYVNPIQLPRNK